MKQPRVLLIGLTLVLVTLLSACTAVSSSGATTAAQPTKTVVQPAPAVEGESTAVAPASGGAPPEGTPPAQPQNGNGGPSGAPPQGTPPVQPPDGKSGPGGPGGPGGAPPEGAPPGPPPDGTPAAGGPGGPGGAPPDANGGGGGDGASTTNPVLTSTCGSYTFDGTSESSNGQSYASTAADQSSICLINGGSLTLTNPTITKTGDSSSSDNSSFYGLNAAVLAGSGSSITVSGGTITANGAGANGAFATGSGSSVTLSNVLIKASGDGAHAVMATLGGTMTLTNVDMLTTDSHSGAIATDRGSGTLDVTGGKVTTTGADSPGIYSTGGITVTGATINAAGAESAVIEGGNTITLVDTDLSSSLAGKWGVMIYQSMSGDAEGTKGTFTMTGGSLANTATTGPLFYVNNSTGVINLNNVSVTAASGILADASANSRWGNSGSNGGNIVLTADAQALTGDITADNISTLAVTLQNGSTLKGAINNAHTAKTVRLTLDASSTWNVAADSYITSLSDAAGISGTTVTNITGNGHTVYYDASASPDLGGKTYTLNGGGTLQPAS